MAWAPTTEQILNLDGVRRRFDTFRFELLDRDEQPIGELHPSRDRPPSISNDSGRTVPRSLSSLYLPASEMADVNVLENRVRVWMTLQNGVEFSLGVFLWGDDSEPLRGWGHERFSSLVDKTYLLDQKSQGSFGWTAGVHAGIALLFLMFKAGLTLDDLGESFGTDTSVNTALSWQPGTDWLRAMTDILELVGNVPPWANRDGKINLVPAPNPNEVDTDLVYALGTRIVKNTLVHSDDLLTAPNFFQVYSTDPNSSFRGSFSVPASAPHSEANRGFRVSLVEGMQGITSSSQARTAARQLASSRGQAFEWVRFSSTADPRHDTWDVITAPDREGELVNWLEVSWSLECRTGGLMDHVARRVYD